MATMAYTRRNHGTLFWAGVGAAVLAAVPAFDAAFAHTITRRLTRPRFRWLDASPGAFRDAVVVLFHGLWAGPDMHIPLLDVYQSIGQVLLVSHGAEVNKSVQATLDELERHGLLLNQVFVVGPSFGSVMARIFDKAYKERTGRVASHIFDCPPKAPEDVIWPDAPLPLTHVVRVIRGGPVSQACWWYINRRSLAKARASCPDGEVTDQLMSVTGRSKCRLITVLAAARCLRDRTNWPSTSLEGPVLVIYQPGDNRVRTQEDWSAIAPHATVQLLDDEPGHVSFHRSHEAYRRKITKWIGGLELAA
jgi:hypothetical protein